MAQAFNATAIRTAGVAVFAGLMSMSPARSQGWTPDAAFVEAGHSRRGTDVLGLGLKWQWDWQALRWGGRFSAAGEVSASRWAADTVSGSRTQAQFALVPLLRYTPGEGRSAWFVEAGIGLSLHRRRYEVDDVRMSTRWNFYDVLAVGRRFGDADEVSLRAVHVSNGGARKPNPGDELILLRWARRF